MQPLQGLMDELKAEGVFDQDGRFTVRSDAALRKLRQSCLGDPSVYAVALFRAIVCSGARSVSVDWSLENLSLAFDGPGLPEVSQLVVEPAADRTMRYLQIGLLGAMSLEPQQIGYLGPGAGWTLVSPELPAQPQTVRQERSQLVIRRRLGKGSFWSIARRMLKEMPEVEGLRQRCASTEISLHFKGKPIEQPLLAGRRWEISTPGVPLLRLKAQLPPLVMPPTDPPPMPLHALFLAREFPGPGNLWITLAGAGLSPLPLPWPDVDIMVSVLDLDLDLSQGGLVENQAYRMLLEWLAECWYAILKSVANQPQWQGLVRREVLRPHSPLRDELSHLPLFGGRSLDTLCRSVIPVGRFPKDIEQALLRGGARLRNDDLGKCLLDRPDLRAEVLLVLAQRHGLRWALSDLDPDLALVPGQGAELAERAPELLARLASPALASHPGAHLAYLEAGLLHPQPAHALADPHPLGSVAANEETSINELFQHYLEFGELTLTEAATRSPRGSEGFQTSREVAQRIFLGLFGESITWNHRYTQNALADDRFRLFPLVRERASRIPAHFSAVVEENGMLRLPLSPGHMEIDRKHKLLHFSSGALPLTIPGRRLKELVSFQIPVGGKGTEFCETICFTDGLHNYVLEQCGPQQVDPAAKSPDLADPVHDGARLIGEELRLLAIP